MCVFFVLFIYSCCLEAIIYYFSVGDWRQLKMFRNEWISRARLAVQTGTFSKTKSYGQWFQHCISLISLFTPVYLYATKACSKVIYHQRKNPNPLGCYSFREFV